MFPIKDSITIPRSPIAVYLIILANTVVFLYQQALSDEASGLFLLHYALVPRRYFDAAWAAAHGFASGDYWPLITGVFMHGGWWHLIINMWTLYIFGRSVEGRVGAMPFLIPLFRFSPNRTKDEDPVYWSSRWPFTTQRPKAKEEVDELGEFPWHRGPWG
jgi:membrane associated rhomboid family serine protease